MKHLIAIGYNKNGIIKLIMPLKNRYYVTAGRETVKQF